MDKYSEVKMNLEELDEEHRKLVERFGASYISSLKKRPNFRTFNKGLIFSHRDFDKYVESLEKGEKCAIVSGFNASGTMHYGHKAVFDTNLFFQKEYGVDIFIPISDDESYVVGKIKTQEEGMNNSLELARQLLAYGFDPSKTKIVIDQIFTNIYNLAIKFTRGTTFNMVKATYGFTGETNVGMLFYPCVQAAHILSPHLKEYGSYKRVLVPIGIDEDSHIRISRDIAARFGFEKPSVLHTQFIPDINGKKMSKSRPEGCIFLNEDPKIAKKKIMNALTGGRDTIERHRVLGGEPVKCIVFKYLKYYVYNDDQIRELEEQCKSGKILCGECKKILADFVKEDIQNFQNKLKKITLKDVEDVLLKNNI